MKIKRFWNKNNITKKSFSYTESVKFEKHEI